jgi:hypothetical protein
MWIKLAYVLDKYRVLVWLAGSALLVFGFGVRTPASQFAEIRDEIKTNHVEFQRQIDTLHAAIGTGTEERQQIKNQTQFITRYICSRITVDDKYRLGGTDACASAAHDASSNYIH